jgi:transposase
MLLLYILGGAAILVGLGVVFSKRKNLNPKKVNVYEQLDKENFKNKELLKVILQKLIECYGIKASNIELGTKFDDLAKVDSWKLDEGGVQFVEWLKRCKFNDFEEVKNIFELMSLCDHQITDKGLTLS